MKQNHKFISILICLTVISLLLCCCNVPQKQDAAEPELVPVSEEDMIITDESDTAEEDALPEIQEEIPDNDELPLIVNPGRSSLPAVSHASAGPLAGSAAYRVNTQIIRPTASADSGSGLMITNEHTVTYPETQSVIQKSAPSGQLQPLSYIPPAQLANGQSIVFGWGETSAVVSGYVPAGGTVSYNLYAFANQNFLVLLSSDSGTSVLSVSDVYGNVMLDANQRQTSFNTYLPRTATYYVNVHSTGYAENFTLQVFIPARVTIPAGQTKAVMSGSMGAYGVVSYTAYMYAGQVARVDDYSGGRPTSFLRVSGLQTGVVYMDYTAYSPSWYSVVPATQDYLIEVISMDQPSNYQLTIDVRAN